MVFQELASQADFGCGSSCQFDQCVHGWIVVFVHAFITFDGEVQRALPVGHTITPSRNGCCSRVGKSRVPNTRDGDDARVMWDLVGVVWSTLLACPAFAPPSRNIGLALDVDLDCLFAIIILRPLTYYTLDPSFHHGTSIPTRRDLLRPPRQALVQGRPH